jgi:pSer/pThr/pTyr-binding forkhead associated (FHA) protein
MQRGGLIDSPWSTPVVPAPSPHAPATAPVRADDALEGYTIARSALRGHRTASLVLPDGRTLDLTRAVVLGRNPDANRGPAGAVAVAHGDPSLSKTHAVVEADGDLVYVTDLHSTNGTVIESAGGRSSCAPAVRIAIPEHAVVRLGDVAIRVTPAP